MDQENPITRQTSQVEPADVLHGRQTPDAELQISNPGRAGEKGNEKKTEPQRVEIVLRVEAAEAKTGDTVKEEGRGQTTDDRKNLSPTLAADRKGSAEIEESKGKTEDRAPRG